MTSSLDENDVELFAIELLEAQGYVYSHGNEVAPDGRSPLRERFEDVVLEPCLREAIARINPDIPEAARDDALRKVLRIGSPDLINVNQQFHEMLTEGVRVTYKKDGRERGDLVWLVDFEHPESNEFRAVNQFVVSGNATHRPDFVLFVNGLPLVVSELKNPTDQRATVESAYKQLQTYKQGIPALFAYNGVLVISDGLDTKAGSLSAELGRFMAWRSLDGKKNAPDSMPQLEVLIKGMLSKETLLDLVRHFIVFERSSVTDPATKQSIVTTAKKIAGYHQYYAVNKAVKSVIRAANIRDAVFGEGPELYRLPDVEKQAAGDRKGGVVWHTQGAGKSLSMVFVAGKLILTLDNPTILVLTDRNDLDDQLFEAFAASKQLLRQTPVQAESRRHLKKLLKVASGGVVFTTIQKFRPDNGNEHEQLSDRKNIVVIADEAHRTQYGFGAKTTEVVDENDITGVKTVYGFAKYMRDALPNATYLGFTGTPVEGVDKNTPAVFGNYVDVYDIERSIEDGATVPIHYESRLAKIRLSDEGRQLIREMEDKLYGEAESEVQSTSARWTRLEALVGNENRVNTVAADMVEHFEARQSLLAGKGMVVAMSRRIAIMLYDAITKIRPEWHSDELRRGTVKVVITAAASDGPEMKAHHTSKEERRVLAERMRNPQDELKLVIVCNMWLTGFNVPPLNTIYIDKPMRGHNLMQAIARVNRVYEDKPAGLVVDYLGIASDLQSAVSFYTKSGGKGEPVVDHEKAVGVLLEKLEIVSQMFHGFDYKRYFGATTSQKLSIILGAQEHILGLEDGKKRFVEGVVQLSKALAIATPHEKALAVRDEVAFFQAVKARLVKFERSPAGGANPDLEIAVKQAIDEALVTEPVVDVFEAAGIKKPDISILSEEFLREINAMKHRNLAFEVLKKLLNDDIRARSKRSIVEGRRLMEMLEDAIRRYHNKVITAAEVVDELIAIAKEIRSLNKKPQEMNLSVEEYAFYTAVANNDSAKELMGTEKLRELAVVLTEKVRINTSIDWTIKESVKSKLKALVKRTLREYGYPPDMEKLATETVLKQAERIAAELAKPSR